MRFEVARASPRCRSQVRRHTYCNHVLLDVFPEVDTRVEAFGDDVHTTVIGRDIEHDIRDNLRAKLTELRRQHGARCQPRHEQANAAGGLSLSPDNLSQRLSNLRERRAQTAQKVLSGVGQRDASRGSRQKTHAECLLRVLAWNGSWPKARHQAFGGPRKAALFRNGEKHGQRAEIICQHL